LWARLGTTRGYTLVGTGKPLTALYFDGRLLALSTNIRLGCKGNEMANTLAYYYKATITNVKCFIVQSLGSVPDNLPLQIKHFTAAINSTL
jgi:hypothetical protein